MYASESQQQVALLFTKTLFYTKSPWNWGALESFGSFCQEL
jgi:hypothetical protein